MKQRTVFARRMKSLRNAVARRSYRATPTRMAAPTDPPEAMAGLFVDGVQARLVGGDLGVAGQQHLQRRPLGRQLQALLEVARLGRLETEPQVALAAGHGQVDVGQDLGVEQRAVQAAAAVVHFVALAQGVEAVALARVQVAGQFQGVQHADVVSHPVRAAQLRPAPRPGNRYRRARCG